MKKAINIIFTVLATLAVLNCGGTVEIPEVPEEKPEKPDPKPEEPEDEGFGGEVTFTATIESLSDGSQPTWKKGESISIYDGESVKTAANTENDGPVGKFPATIKKNTEAVFALYPAVEGIQPTATSVNLEIPAVQTIGTPVPAYRVAKGKSDLLYFRNLLGKVNISVEFDGVTSVVIEADEATKIAGMCTVDYSGDSPVVIASSSKVELKGEFKKGEVYSVVLAPAVFTKCSVDAYIDDKVVARTNLDGQTLAAGSTIDLATMASENPVYKITHLWLWGGTGPEWDGTRVLDLFTLGEVFNNDDGRGVAALKDNYLVFNSDGTFNNWAGADGRNWWHVYNGSKNPETGLDLDLSKFYEVLPRSTGTFVKEDNAITFTRTDGSKVKAELIDAGEYKMNVPETNPNGKPIPPRAVTISSQALRFEITGTRDVWTEGVIYTSYDEIAVHPRLLYIELEKMPDGFTVPDASKTTDANYEFVPPVYEFDYTKLPGTWIVRGSGSKAPFGLWVNGGSGDQPGFVSPIDKLQYGTWNDSILKELDNTLTLAITGQTATEINGTFTWGYGDDGEHWDYKWNKQDSHSGEDLSRFYDVLPEGENTVTVNLSTGAGKLNGTKDFTFVTPGVRSFTLKKTLEIPTGCFALAFHIMDPVPATADLWQDVDRFINAPLDYVIIFEKKTE